MTKLTIVLAMLCGFAVSATAQVPTTPRGDRGTVSLRASVGVFAPVLPLVAFANGGDANLDLQAGAAFGLEMDWMITNGFGLYAGSTGFISRINHSTALLTAGPARTTSQVTVVVPSGGFILAPRIGRLGFRPMLRLGAGVKFYSFELTEVQHGVQDVTGDLGIGLIGGLGPVSIVSEARWIFSMFDPRYLPVAVQSGPKQRQNDWLLLMGFRYRLAAATQPAAAPPTIVPVRPPPRPKVAAHRERSLEWTAGPSLFAIDPALNDTLAALGITTAGPSRFMVGGEVRATYNISRKVGIGLGASMGKGNGARLVGPFVAATYTLDLNAGLSPFVELGAVTNRFSGNGASVRASYAGFGGVGVRAMLGRTIALRVEGRMAYDRYAELGGAAYNAGAFIGLSYFMGSGTPRDTDADGVPDRRDTCPNTPSGALVDTRGCPPPAARATEPDSVTRTARPDSVPRVVVAPAITPAITPPAAPAGPRDSDRDSVTDDLDRCPATPPNARPVDANGCPVDTDRDGVADYLDHCPGTTPNAQISADGCPVRRALPEVGQALASSSVQFEASGNRLTPESEAVLDYVAAAILAIPNSRWEVGGYASSATDRAANARLSLARAREVVRQLVGRGVSARALAAVGHGPENPVAPDATPAGRALNQRVEIRRIR